MDDDALKALAVERQAQWEPAFPIVVKIGDTPHTITHLGLSVRDWFAGQAIAGMSLPAHKGDREAQSTFIAEAAYHYADAMLEARGRKRE